MNIDVYVPGKKRGERSELNSGVKFIIFAAALIISFTVIKIIFKVQFARDDSMNPSIKNGSIIVINKIASVKKNDPVLVKIETQSGRAVLSRIIAEAGDTVEIREKKILINGSEFLGKIVSTDKRVFSRDFINRDFMDKVTVPQDSFFVIGDNFDRSFDSRYFGAVKKESIAGKIIADFF